jgi:thioredoxin-like negative regulator of GroEL
VDSPDPIPLGEAVARGIIPCSVCGAKGADVRKVGDKNHFLCARCAGKGRAWTWILVGLTVAVVGLAVFLLSRGKKPVDPRPSGARGQDPEPWLKETLRLMEMKRYADARVRIQELLEPLPKQPELNLLMGRCLMALRAYDAALPYLTIAYEAGPPFRDEAALRLGLSLKTIGRAAQALKYLEERSGPEPRLRSELAEVYLDLERYDDALKLLPEPSDSGALWARHRVLVYQGKADDARKLLDSRDEQEVATLRAGQLREEGDFAGARKILESLKPEPGSPAWHRVQRGLLSLAIESGNLGPLEAVVDELAADKDPQIQGEAIFATAIAELLRGQKNKAVTSAWKFLAKTDKEFSPLRLERMMMRHLAGELKDADLEAEAKLLSRFHANDLLWYLALATGDRAWAERALASTPGHNYPYHSIRRILNK